MNLQHSQIKREQSRWNNEMENTVVISWSNKTKIKPNSMMRQKSRFFPLQSLQFYRKMPSYFLQIHALTIFSNVIFDFDHVICFFILTSSSSRGNLLVWQCTPSKPGWHLQMYSLKTSPRRVGVTTSHNPSFLQGFGLQGPEKTATRKK